jgi:hypothetical protein
MDTLETKPLKENSMKRDEAVTLLREISNSCHNLSPDFVSLIKSKPDDQLSVGYQLHIQLAPDVEVLERISVIASKNCLAISREDGKEIIIYKPKTAQA